MSSIPTDKQISDKLATLLPSCLTNHNNSLGNSIILNSKYGVLFIFVSNSFKPNRSNQFYLIVLNLSLNQQNGVSLHSIPIHFKQELKSFTQQIYQKTKIQLIKNKYVEGLLAITIKRQSSYKTSQKIYVSQLNVETLMKVQKIEFTQIQLKCNHFHKCLWHAYAPFTILILAQKSLLIYDLQKSTFTQQVQIDLSYLQRQNKIQCSRDTQLVNMGFAKINLNPYSEQRQASYKNLIKKFQLFLVDKIGRIYLLYPFLCQGIVISNIQSQDLNYLRDKYNNQFIRILKQFQLEQINETQSDQRNFRILYSQKQLSTFQPFLKQIKSNTAQDYELRPNALKDFQIFQVQNKTLFASCTFNNREKCNIIKITLLPGQLQQCFLTQDMNINEVIQFQVAQIISDQMSNIIDQVRFLKPIQDCRIYFLQEKKCYQINLLGLANHFKVQSSSISPLVQVSKLFNAKQSKIIALNKNEDQIMMIRFNKNKFYYDCITLKGLKITESFKEINKEIIKAFEITQQNHKKSKFEEDPVFQKMDGLNLSQIETKLEKFSKDFKICVENKMLRIKSLYEQVQDVKLKTQKNQKINNKMLELIKAAQKNDIKIKTLVQQKKKQASPKQKQLLTRIQNVKFLINKINEEYSLQRQNLDKSIIQDFQTQAKGILSQMKLMRQKSEEKIIELRNFATSKKR